MRLPMNSMFRNLNYIFIFNLVGVHLGICQANASGFSSNVLNPCEYRSLEGMPAVEPKKIFDSDTSRYFAIQKQYAYYNFQFEFKSNPEIALKNWLITTETFAKTSVHEIQISLISERGTDHKGIYEVSSVQKLDRKFILKVSSQPMEAEMLWRIQNSIFTHPECFLQSKVEFNQVASFFPKFPKVYEAAQFSLDWRPGLLGFFGMRGSSFFPILIEKVPGQALAILDKTEPAILDIYRSVGRSLGYLHYFLAQDRNKPFENWETVTHGDLHGNNVFFDEKSGSVFFIDHSTMDISNRIGYDFYQAGYGAFGNSLNTGHSIVGPYFRNLQEVEAKRRGMSFTALGADCKGPAASGEIHRYDALLAALENPAIIEQFLQSEHFKSLEARFARFKNLVRGYLDVFPDEKKDEIRKYFGESCRFSLEEFMRTHSCNQYPVSAPIDPRFESSIRKILPADFLLCADKNEI